MNEWNYVNIEYIIENDYYGMRDEEGEQEVIAELFQQTYVE